MNATSGKDLSSALGATKTSSEKSSKLATDPTLLSTDSPILKEAKVVVSVALGEAELSVYELLALKSGSVVKLNSGLNEPVELWLNNSLVARGEIVSVEGHFAVRIAEIAPLG